jgi:N-acylglucosamine 2-epimerase
MENYPALYKNELLSNVVPFWDAHGIDLESGGFFSCLDRAGNVYDTDKFIWLQCRGVWMYSTLHHTVERNPEWIKSAEHGATFLEKYGRDEKGNWYFSLNRQGRPLTQPYSLYSDCYAAMAFAALYKCTGEDVHAEIVQQTFANILARRNNPKGIYNKAYPGTRPLKTFSMAMILCNLALEAEHLLGKQTVDSLIDDIIFEVMDVFYKKERGLV